MLRWRFWCTGLQRLPPHNRAICKCVWIEPNQQQPEGQIIIGWGQKSYWRGKCIRWHPLNASISMNYSNLMNVNYFKKSEQWRPLPEAHPLTNLLKWRLLDKKMFAVQQTWLPTIVWIFRSIYLVLGLKMPPSVLLICTAVWISWREWFMVTLWMSRCGAPRYCQYSCSNWKLGCRQLASMSSRKLLNTIQFIAAVQRCIL